MSMYITEKTEVGEPPVFTKILESSPSGVLIKVDARVPTDLHTLYEGTPIATTATAGVYKWMKSALLSTAHSSGAANTRLRIKGPNPFKIGDIVCVESEMAVGTIATISAVAATYIVLPVTKYTADKHDVVYQVAADGATAPFARPYGLLGHSVRVREDDGVTSYNVFGPLVFRATAVVSNYKWGYTADVKNRLITNNHMRFITKNQV